MASPRHGKYPFVLVVMAQSFPLCCSPSSGVPAVKRLSWAGWSWLFLCPGPSQGGASGRASPKWDPCLGQVLLAHSSWVSQILMPGNLGSCLCVCGLETFGRKGFLTRWEKSSSDCNKSNVDLAELRQPRALLLRLVLVSWLCGYGITFSSIRAGSCFSVFCWCEIPTKSIGLGQILNDWKIISDGVVLSKGTVNKLSHSPVVTPAHKSVLTWPCAALCCPACPCQHHGMQQDQTHCR